MVEWSVEEWSWSVGDGTPPHWEIPHWGVGRRWSVLLTQAIKSWVQVEPAIERVQALADISRSALYAFAVYKAISLNLRAYMLS